MLWLISVVVCNLLFYAHLQECLDSFIDTDFWYVDQGIVADHSGHCIHNQPLQRQEEKWWLPIPRVSVNGLSEEGKKFLQHHRECISQILKAAVAINNQVLSEMEIPSAYWDALPKVFDCHNLQACLTLYRLCHSLSCKLIVSANFR